MCVNYTLINMTKAKKIFKGHVYKKSTFLKRNGKKYVEIKSLKLVHDNRQTIGKITALA